MTHYSQFNTKDYSGMIAETVNVPCGEGKTMRAYYTRPLGITNYPSIVLIPHMPGWDEYLRETARRFTEHGYAVLCPDIYQGYGDGTPSEVAQRAREAGGVYDSSVLTDCTNSLSFLANQQHSNGSVGVIGMCSGGRHALLAACSIDGFDGCVDLWGGGCCSSPEEATEAKPVAPIELIPQLNCPLLGVFGNDDKHPSKEEVDRIEEVLKANNKNYQFYRYDGAGHAFWSMDRDAYRPAAAIDSFNKTLDFFGQYLTENKE